MTKDELYKLLDTVMKAVMADSKHYWHPDPLIDQDNWNPDATVELSLTVGECREIKEALIKDNRLPSHWTGQGDSVGLSKIERKEDINQ